MKKWCGWNTWILCKSWSRNLCRIWWIPHKMGKRW